MSGFDHDPLADIADLKGILRDQYEPRSILKELIQNADDAGARSLHLGIDPGCSDAAHPLLRGPALLVLNDGSFEHAHAAAIRKLRVGSKGADASAIGKFGLGLKSVFHVCEAFFYAASPNQEAAAGSPFLQVLNPWSPPPPAYEGAPREPGLHDDWDDRSAAAPHILRRLNAWTHGAERWFCLWLPLRTPEQLGAVHPIKEWFPHLEQLLDTDSAERMAPFFPLLKQLERVTCWRLSGQQLTPDFSLSLSEATTRCLRDRLPAGEARELSGEVWLERGPDRECVLTFAGLERRVTAPELEALTQQNDWPKCVTVNRSTGRSDMVPEKALPHCAVLLSAGPEGSGDAPLEIANAVFLPLARPLHSSDEGNIPQFRLTLHGCFFLDAARREIHRADTDRPESQWNRLLESRGVLPSVLPALQGFVRRTELSRARTRALTRAIHGTSWYAENRQAVGETHQWLFRVAPGLRSWELLPLSACYWCLPAIPAGSDDLPFEVFPALAKWSEARLLTPSDYPRLTAREPASWANDLTWLAGLPAGQVFSNPAHLSYLADFLAAERGWPPEVWTAVVAIANEAISSANFAAVRSSPAVLDAFRQFLKALPRELWLVFPVRMPETPETDRLVQALSSLGLSRLIVHPNWALPQPSAGRLTAQDVGRIFAWLSRTEQRGQRIADAAGAATAFWALEHAAAPRDQLRQESGRFPVFRVYDSCLARERRASWDELDSLRERERLVTAGGLNLLPLMQTALPDEQVVRLVEDNERASRALFSGTPLRALTKASCIALLSSCPRLGPQEGRTRLMEALLGRPDDTPALEYRSALRYLLHGAAAHYSDEAPLVCASTLGPGGLWAKVIRHLLAASRAEWRCVPEELSKKLSEEQARELGVVAATPALADDLLRQAGAESLTQLDLSTDERERLLSDLRNSIFWHDLPLHETTAGELVAVTGEGIYVQGENAVPPALAPLATELRLPQRASLRDVYRERFGPWDHKAALGLALPQDRPDQYYSEILQALRDSARSAEPLPERLRDQLHRTAWLPTPWGARRPADVLDVPGMEDEIARILARPELRGDFIDVGVLPEEARDERVLWFLKGLFPSPAEALGLLGLCLADASQYHLGEPARPDIPTGEVADLLVAFQQADTLDFPGLAVLRSAHQSQVSGAAEILFEHLRRPLPAPRLRACLAAIAGAHERTSAEHRAVCFRVFNRYLASLVSQPGFRLADLQSVRLLSRAQKWREASELCFDATGIDENALLCVEQADILSIAVDNAAPSTAPEFVSSKGPAEERRSKVAGRRVLAEYFSSWEGLVTHEFLGGFYALLGDDPELLSLAAEHLEPKRTALAVRRELEWQINQSAQDARRGYQTQFFGGGERREPEDIHELMARRRFRFRVADDRAGATCRVMSVTGSFFEAPISSRVDTLFLGQIRPESDRTYAVTLRQIEPTSYRAHELRALLIESARELLFRAYWQRPGNLDEVMNRLAESEQIDLDIAQARILDQAFSYFRQMNGQQLGRLRELAKQWNDLYYREYEEQQQSRSSGARSASAREQREQLREKLRSALVSDPEVRAETLAAVREKIHQYAYQPSSIPFELFQNADDAAVELCEMLAHANAPGVNRLVVAWKADTLLWMHWGRPINVFRAGGYPEQEGRRRGFHDDLPKMLVLSASDKSVEGAQVTGKFGLGFKSVFLFTDAPRVLSGQLGFEVAGGLFPRRLESSEREHLRRFLEAAEPHSRSGTLLELRGNGDVALDEVLDSFRQLIHVLLVFSRQVKECELRLPTGSSEVVTWQEEPLVSDTSRLRAGELRPASGSGSDPCRALVLRAGAAGALLLALGPRGVRRLPGRVPAFWVTAPTREGVHTGFAVNAPFALDVGRSQLAVGAVENLQVADRLGDWLGETLLELFDRASDWPTVRSALRLAEDVTPMEFWESLWALLGQHLSALSGETEHTSLSQASTEGLRLLQRLLWSQGRGMHRLLRERSALPSGLAGAYRRLVCLDEVRWVVEGELARTAVFNSVSEWDVLRQRVSLGQAVSGSGVCRGLRKLLDQRPAWEPVDLARVLEWEPGTNVSPQQAARWGTVVTRTFLERLRQDDDGSEEAKRLTAIAGCRQFRTRSGEYQVARDLVAAHRKEDSKTREEILRAAFAPLDRLLYCDYQGPALEFFDACREEMRAPASTLADWGLAASTPAQQQAFLRYLVEGELGKGVSDALRGRTPGTWLSCVESTGKLSHLAPDEQAVVLGRLGLARPLEGPPPPSPPPAPDTLERIHAWWDQERDQHLRRYDHETYPDPDMLWSRIRARFDETTEERQAWLLLLLRGALETMGMMQPDQHRGFLDLIQKHPGLGQVLNHAGDPETIVRSIEAYLDECVQKVQWFPWIKESIPVLITARWLDDYIRAFLSANIQGDRFRLDGILCPRTEQRFARGGPDAPPLAILGQIGGHFVLRELVRQKRICRPEAHPFCFVPSRRVCELLEWLGSPPLLNVRNRAEQSRRIHTFLLERLGRERVTFGGAFDIPFRVLASGGGHWQQVIGTQPPELSTEESFDE